MRGTGCSFEVEKIRFGVVASFEFGEGATRVTMFWIWVGWLAGLKTRRYVAAMKHCASKRC